jgi:hypothetical protein
VRRKLPPLAKTEPRPFVDVTIWGDQNHLLAVKGYEDNNKSLSELRYECGAHPTYKDRRRVFRIAGGGRMPRICPSCVRAQPRARIVEDPPPKKRKADD